MVKRFNFILGLSGAQRSGKDSLFEGLSDILKNHNINLERIALADILKHEVNEFTQKHYGISAFTKETKEKEVIRGLLIEHGRGKRLQTSGTYWTGLLEDRIQDILNDGDLPCCTDIRYCDPNYPNDELDWLRKKNGILIHVQRILPNGLLNQPNQEELKFDGILQKNADYKLGWPTTDDRNLQIECINLQLSELINKIIDVKK